MRQKMSGARKSAYIQKTIIIDKWSARSVSMRYRVSLDANMTLFAHALIVDCNQSCFWYTLGQNPVTGSVTLPIGPSPTVPPCW